MSTHVAELTPANAVLLGFGAVGTRVAELLPRMLLTATPAHASASVTASMAACWTTAPSAARRSHGPSTRVARRGNSCCSAPTAQ